MRKKQWPEKMPVLEGRNCCRGMLNGDNDTHCLYGWFLETTRFYWHWGEKNAYVALFTNAIIASAEDVKATSIGLCAVSSINDDNRNSLAMLARIWNRAIAKLGYVVGNPECDKNGNLKPVKNRKRQARRL